MVEKDFWKNNKLDLEAIVMLIESGGDVREIIRDNTLPRDEYMDDDEYIAKSCMVLAYIHAKRKIKVPWRLDSSTNTIKGIDIGGYTIFVEPPQGDRKLGKN